MTTMLLEKRAAEPVARPMLTLETLVTRAWTELELRGRTACPACDGAMETRLAPDGAGVVGHCAGCGSELA